MNTISDSLIEKLEELYPKTKPEVVPVKEEPVVVNTWEPDYTITSGGGYAIQSTNSGINLPPTWGTVITSPITNLDEMKVKENSVSYETTLKQYINDKMIALELRIQEHIKQEIDKLKCNPGTPT
jgi:hypothetical protein